MHRIDALKIITAAVSSRRTISASVRWRACIRIGGIFAPPIGNTFNPIILGSITTTAMGVAFSLPHRKVLALETDGSVLTNTGALCTLGSQRPGNLTVVVLDNGIYEIIGGAPTLTAQNTDLAKMASGAGCINTVTVKDAEGLKREFQKMWTTMKWATSSQKSSPACTAGLPISLRQPTALKINIVSFVTSKSWKTSSSTRAHSDNRRRAGDVFMRGRLSPERSPATRASASPAFQCAKRRAAAARRLWH